MYGVNRAIAVRIPGPSCSSYSHGVSKRVVISTHAPASRSRLNSESRKGFSVGSSCGKNPVDSICARKVTVLNRCRSSVTSLSSPARRANAADCSSHELPWWFFASRASSAVRFVVSHSRYSANHSFSFAVCSGGNARKGSAMAISASAERSVTPSKAAYAGVVGSRVSGSSSHACRYALACAPYSAALGASICAAAASAGTARVKDRYSGLCGSLLGFGDSAKARFAAAKMRS